MPQNPTSSAPELEPSPKAEPPARVRFKVTELDVELELDDAATRKAFERLAAAAVALLKQ